MKTTYISGKWLAICDICGLRFYNDQLQKNWQGLMVDQKCYETRHPQDFIKVPIDNPAIPWARPEAPDDFIQPYFCTLKGIQGLAGIGIAGCMRAGFRTPYE